MSFDINNIPLWKPAKRVKYRKQSKYPLKYVYSDFFEGSTKVRSENNDCTVRALAIAAEMPYDEAHQLLAVQCGRKDKHGASFINLIGSNPSEGRVIGDYFVKWHNVKTQYTYNHSDPYARSRVSGTTVRQFVTGPDVPKRCVLSIQGHVMACINGVVHDTFNAGARSILQGYYSFEKVWQ